MADNPSSFNLKVTRKQGVMLAVLGVVLAYVVFQGSPQPDAANQAASADAESPPARRKLSTKPVQVATLRRISMPVEQMIKQNPFAKLPDPPKPLPPTPKVVAPQVTVTVVKASAPSPEVLEAEKQTKERRQKIQQTIAELQGAKVKMILKTDKKTSAMIGNRLVSEGDVIDGVRIVSMLPSGVIVKPAE